MHDPQLTDLKRTWLDEVLPLAELAVKTFDTFTSDDLHDLRSMPRPEHRNYWGVLLSQLSHRQIIHRVGYRASKRPEANGRVIAVWSATR
jgi:hypothetical protein